LQSSGKVKNVAEHNSAPKRGLEQVLTLQYSPAIAKNNQNTTEVYIRNNSPWSNMNPNLCGQDT
jgi:hypothetical protein